MAGEAKARIPRDSGVFLGIVIGLATGGFYTGLFVMTIWVTAAKGWKNLRSPVMYGVITLWVLNLLVTASIMGEAYDQWIAPDADHGNTQQVNKWIAMQDFVMSFSETIGDAIVGWRLYVIWDRKQRVLQVLWGCLIISLGYAFGICIYDILMARYGMTHYMDAYNVLAVTQFASTVLFNLVVTGLVVWLLRRAEKPFENNPDAPSYGLYTKVSIVLIQSGAMYSVVLGTYLILYYIDTAVPMLLAPSLTRVVGIAPTLIVLQRALGYIHPNDVGGSNYQDSGMKFDHGTNLTSVIEFGFRSMISTVSGRRGELRSRTQVPNSSQREDLDV